MLATVEAASKGIALIKEERPTMMGSEYSTLIVVKAVYLFP